jgi:ring-1,2-phenylacetyl-CoA epoxidase subunit PaaE
MVAFHSVKIKEIRTETSDSISILFDIPDNLRSEFDFVAGQYITIKKNLDGTDLRRSYSLCSTPGTDSWRIGIKAVQGGQFSSYATTQLRAGDVLDIGTPEGLFQLKTDPLQSKHYLGIVAGSGITPVLSMIKAVLKSEPLSRFTLIYGNRTIASAMFKAELDELAAKYTDTLKVYYVCSREDSDHGLFGRIDKGNLLFLLKKDGGISDDSYDQVFICGPEAMTKNVIDVMSQLDYSDQHISTELFTPPEEKMENSDRFKGDSLVRIILDDEETEITVGETETILGAALNEGLDPPHSCQGGICSSCLALITEGSAVMEKNTVLSDEEVKDGLILTCQAHPTSKNLSIDYDDV